MDVMNCTPTVPEFVHHHLSAIGSLGHLRISQQLSYIRQPDKLFHLCRILLESKDMNLQSTTLQGADTLRPLLRLDPSQFYSQWVQCLDLLRQWQPTTHVSAAHLL